MPNNERQLKYQARKDAEKANIPGMPLPLNMVRRDGCRFDLPLFLTTYFPHSTGLKPFSLSHLSAIERMQYSILEGGSVVMTCFPRGFGKTTISENVALWATLYGHRKFVPIIGADKGSAVDNIASLKFELTENDLLAEDFPEVVIPFKMLDNKAQRCANQKHQEELTYIRWNSEELGFAWIKDSNGKYLENSGATFRCLGITGRIRGMSIKYPDGTKQRPDFFILDDPQTDESALSPTQCDKRLSIYQKSILRLGGHSKLLSGIINATVIEPDDMVDNLLSHEKHPEVEGMRIPMLTAMADRHEELWMDRYSELRRTYNPEDPRDRRRAINEANQFYAENQYEMDEGAGATWHHCFAEDDGELSAIQHAYNILIDDGPVVFASECQNEPISRRPVGIEFLTAKEILSTRVGMHRHIPKGVETIALHIDVQKRALYYCVTGFTDNFTIHPIEYGIFPEQRSTGMSYSRVRNTLQRKYKGMSDEMVLTNAIKDLLSNLMSKTYLREDGLRLRCELGLVDGGYQTDSVHKGVSEAGMPNTYVAHGRGIKAADTPMMSLPRRSGERRSKDPFVPWRMLPDQNRRSVKYILFCANSAKTFTHRRIRTDLGEPGSFQLPAGDHRDFASHLSDSEFPTETEGPYGRVIEWGAVPGRPDNHLFDCLVGSVVAGGITGKLKFGEITPPPAPKVKKVSYL